MKKNFCLILVFCFFIFQSSVYSTERIKILTTQYPPYQYIEEGEVRGFSAEVVKLILSNAGINAEISVVPWARAEKELTSQKNIFFFNLSRTVEREDKFIWIADITPANIYIWKLKSRKDIVINSLDDIKYYMNSVLPNSVSHNYLKSINVPNNKILEVTINKQSIKMLDLERVDIVPQDEISFLTTVRSDNDLKFSDFERVTLLEEISGVSYLVASKDSDLEIINKLKESWKKIKKSDKYNELYDNFIRSLER